MEEFESIKKQIKSGTILVLDLDGTLIDLGVNWLALKSELENYCKKNYGAVSFSRLYSGLEEAKNQFGTKLYDKLIKIIEKHELDNKNYRPNDELISYVNNIENKIVIYSMNTSNCIKSFVKKYLNNKPIIVISKETCLENKPTNKDLLEIINKLNVNKKDVLFIGNSRDDLLSGEYSGIKTYLINF